jgi:hypothetical protein
MHMSVEEMRREDVDNIHLSEYTNMKMTTGNTYSVTC